jgi:hypothetical protein
MATPYEVKTFRYWQGSTLRQISELAHKNFRSRVWSRLALAPASPLRIEALPIIKGFLCSDPRR